MLWNDFLLWFSSKCGYSSLSNNKRKIIIVNIDMIARLPNKNKKSKKTKKTTKKNTTTIEDFLRYVRFYQSVTAIFISEMPLSQYKFIIKPIIIGDIPNYKNAIWCSEKLLYGNLEEKNNVVRNVEYLQTPLAIINDFLAKSKTNYKEFYRLASIYLRSWKLIESKALRKMISNLIPSLSDKDSIKYPRYYHKFFEEIDMNQL